MSGLKPEKRLDKNGRLVTRHVKDTALPKKTPLIPAPQQATSTPSPQELSAALPMSGATSLGNGKGGLGELWKGNYNSLAGYSLEDFDPRAVHRVEELRKQAASYGTKFGLDVAITGSFKDMSDHGIPTSFHNIAVFGQCTIPYGNVNVNDYVFPLQEMNAPDEVDYLTDASEEQIASARALIEFTVRIEQDFADSVVYYSTENPEEVMDYVSLRDPELTRFIMDNPDTVEDIISVLTQNGGPLPVETIKDRLNHQQQALREGVL